jgi:hypothetical protein
MHKGQLGTILAVVLSLWGAIEFIGLERSWNTEFHDPYLIAAQHQRFEGVRQLIPADAVVSYASDLQPGSVVWSAAFNGAQYVLAPRLLEEGFKREWLLVNYSQPADFAALGQQHGFRIELDFGGGVLVMRKEQR